MPSKNRCAIIHGTPDSLRPFVTYQMWPPHLVHRLSIIQLDIQILIYALECAADLDFVLEFDGDFVLDKCFEKTAT
jgi:hypothetical protein